MAVRMTSILNTLVSSLCTRYYKKGLKVLCRTLPLVCLPIITSRYHVHDWISQGLCLRFCFCIFKTGLLKAWEQRLILSSIHTHPASFPGQSGNEAGWSIHSLILSPHSTAIITSSTSSCVYCKQQYEDWEWGHMHHNIMFQHTKP